MRERINNVVKKISIILIVGLVYAGICIFTNFGIPCMFRVVTGYKCPGCGISRMFLALMRLDFVAAYNSNQVLFCMLPFAFIYFIYCIFRYIKNGNTKMGKAEHILLYCVIALLMAWGIIRNII